jgi:large subunit ribosomal protein L9
MVETLSKTEITIEAQVGEEEKMFGSVTTLDIHKALEEKGIEVDRHAIMLEEPIKALGIYHVPVRVSADLNGDVKIYVIKS